MVNSQCSGPSHSQEDVGFLVEIFEIVSSPISLRLGANKNFSTLIIDSSGGSIFIFMASAAYEKMKKIFSLSSEKTTQLTP